MDLPTKENIQISPRKSTAIFVRNICIAGISIVGISCLLCSICSLVAVLKPNSGNGSELIPMVAIVLSIWVGLNIYNIIGNKEIQLMHEQTEKIKSETDKATQAIHVISNNLAEAENNLLENDFRQKRNVLTALLSVLSDSMEFYSFTSHLLSSFQSPVLFENTSRAVMDLIYRIENTFSAAAKLNRSNSYDERICLAEKGLQYCKECEQELKKVSANDACHRFLQAYINLRKGDFYFYNGYRIETPDGKNQLELAVKSYNTVFDGIYTFYAMNTPDIIEMIINENIPYSDTTLSTILDRNNRKEVIDGLLMQAYLYNIIGECRNVLSQYKDPNMSSAQDKIDAVNYFSNVYKLYTLLSQFQFSDHSSIKIPTLFAKYLRNYGTALEKIPASVHSTVTPDFIYELALKINNSDMLSYRNYSSYKLNMFMCTPLSINSNKDELLKIIDFLDIYITSNPTLATTQYLKGVAYLFLALIDNFSQQNIEYAYRQFRIVKLLNEKFNFDTLNNLINLLKSQYPHCADLLKTV